MHSKGNVYRCEKRVTTHLGCMETFIGTVLSQEGANVLMVLFRPAMDGAAKNVIDVLRVNRQCWWSREHVFLHPTTFFFFFWFDRLELSFGNNNKVARFFLAIPKAKLTQIPPQSANGRTKCAVTGNTFLVKFWQRGCQLCRRTSTRRDVWNHPGRIEYAFMRLVFPEWRMQTYNCTRQSNFLKCHA